MAAPNLLSLTTITGKSNSVTLSDTSVNSLLSNASSSGKVFKINTIVAANIDGASSADVSVFYNDAAAIAGTNYALASTVAVAPDTTLVVLDKSNSIYLEEDRSLGVQASAAGDLTITISYEEIS